MGRNSWIDQAWLYIPEDRRAAMVLGKDIPEKVEGAALFADFCGFTTLTEAFAETWGLRRGADQLPIYLNAFYDGLISKVNSFGGSVISFAGDAITCWFDEQFSPSPGDDPVQRATTCALEMQSTMRTFASVLVPGRKPVTLGVKIAVAYGPACRYLVGDPEILLYDVLAGETLFRMADAEHYSSRGEVVLDEPAIKQLGKSVEIIEWRQENIENSQGRRFALVSGLRNPSRPTPWPDFNQCQLTDEQVRPWVHPVVLTRLQAGMGEFLTELRPTVALFLRFGCINYDNDPQAGSKLNEYICAVQNLVHKSGGSLLEITTGDKGSYLYISYGACVSHEDDARRAVSAALQLRQLNTGLGANAQIQIGVTRGTMRTGAYGGCSRRSFGALGEDVNLAARLMSQAAPGEVLVSRRVHKEILTGTDFRPERFTFEPRSPIKVKGKVEPIPVFSIIGVQQRRSFRLQEPTYALPMVGREKELAIIADKTTMTLDGHGQVVGITGEPGLGKSRLVAEAIHLTRAEGLVGYGGTCQSDGINTSYLVWKPIWWAFFDLDPEAPLRRQVRGLEGEVNNLAPDRLQALPLLGELLGLPLPENDFTQALEPKHRRTALEALLLECLRARAQEANEEGSGLLLVLEDAHWIDSASHDLLERVARAIPDLPVLIILAYRPPEITRIQEPRVEKLTHFTHLHLSELSPAQIEQALRAKLNQLYPEWRGTAPRALIERVIYQAQGNPFFAEELINYLHDRDLDLHDQATIEKVELPTSLNSLVISRIDQLAASQQLTLKVASVLGRIFHFNSLLGYYPDLGKPPEVKADLDILAACELTPLDTSEPELAYLFKHLITHEVAYELLTYGARTQLHEQYAAYLEARAGEGIEAILDQLAYHYERSENLPKKREYLVKAGQAAQRRYANDAALDYYQRTIPLLAVEEQPDVLLKLGQVLELVGKWAEAEAAYNQALELSDKDSAPQANCLTCLGELDRKGGRYDLALQRLEQASLIFGDLGDQDGMAQVLHFQGTVATHQGGFLSARRLYEESLAIRRQQGDNTKIASLLSNLAIVGRVQGQYDQARQLNEEALSMRRELGDKWAIAVSLNNLGNVAINQGLYAEARQLLEEALAIRRTIGDMWVVANTLNNLGNLARDQGAFIEANSHYRESLKIVKEYNDRWALAYLLEDMGCLMCLQSQYERAIRLVGAAEALRLAIGAPRSASEQQKLDCGLEKARQVLGEPAAVKLLEEGKRMNIEEVVVYAAESI